MIIRYIGHASFRIDLDSGVSVVTDPFDPAVGYDLPKTPCDIVTVSHGHHDHNHIGSLAPKHVVSETGSFEAMGVKITGLASYHDNVRGLKRGANVIYVIEADGVRIVHLGDLGHPLSDRAIADLGQPDAVMIPVGGVFTIDARQAAELAGRIGAKVTIPMHYMPPRLSFGLGSVDDFLSACAAAHVIAAELDPAKAPDAPVVVLEYGKGL